MVGGIIDETKEEEEEEEDNKEHKRDDIKKVGDKLVGKDCR